MCACDQEGRCRRCREDDESRSEFRPDSREERLIERYERDRQRPEDVQE